MPYYVHHKDADPHSAAHTYTARVDAVNAAKEDTDLVVTFVISEDERIDWRRREYQRFCNKQYLFTPWGNATNFWEPTNDEDATYTYGAEIAIHFAHLSLKTPGAIAYTPSEEHGYQDRQVTIKVGRYLKQYLTSYLSKTQIDHYIESVKAYSEDLKIARTPVDIVRVYRGGPHSCMSHDVSNYQTSGIHPVEVYGGSDLGVAYLGDLAHASARALVWPDRKYYARVYGDNTLATILENAGYTQPSCKDSDFPSFTGAKVRAIRIPGNHHGYVMPYVDCAESADLVDGGQYFVLCNEEGEYTVKGTDGVTKTVEYNYCEHCEQPCDEDERYCPSCNDNCFSCDRCGDDYFDIDDVVDVDGAYYCMSCASRYEQSCESCHFVWFTSETRTSEYCDTCMEHLTECADCETMIDDRESNDDPRGRRCDSCYKEHTKEDEDETKDEMEDEPTNPSVVYREGHRVDPTISDKLTVYNIDSQPHTVDLLYLVGAIAVHRCVETTMEYPSYTVSHVLTGSAIARRRDYATACRLADTLATPGIDWTVHQFNVSANTLRFARYVLREGTIPPEYQNREEVSAHA